MRNKPKTAYTVNKDKLIATLLYVAQKLIQRRGKLSADIHRVFKIMYFADQESLVRYGRPISTDQYDALPYGPVPSNAYEIVKTIRGDTVFRSDDFQGLLEVKDNKYITPLTAPDMDEFSESDLECLDESIGRHCRMNFDTLTEKSHDKAWNRAYKKGYSTLSLEEIAQDGGAGRAMLDYIREQAENSGLFK
ncbi:MAG: Panacea domain-containing protein [Candidatus Nitrospinota bacterium M3_3B_026]